MPETPVPDLRALRRLLVIRLSSIGDVVHALPVSAALGESFPNLEITWLVEEMSADVVTGNRFLRDVIVIPRARWKRGRRSPHVWREYAALLADLSRRRFDVTLDLHGQAKSAVFALATGARWRFGWRRLRDGAQFVSKALPARPDSVHRVEWYLDTARALGADGTDVKFPLAIPDAARLRARETLCALGLDAAAPYAALNPAVGDQARRWGTARYAELTRLLAREKGLRSVLIGSDKDRTVCDEAAALAADGVGAELRPVSAAGRTGLKELAAVLDGCAVHVCGDTGSAHIAAALGRPVVGIYGPTDPAHAGPWAQAENVLARRDLCRPDCSLRRCAHPEVGPDGTETARCLAAVSPREAFGRVEAALHG